MNQRTTGEKIFNVINLLLLGLLGLTAVYPFIYTLSMSLSTQTEAMRDGLHLYPREVSLTSYVMVLGNSEILTGYANTVFRTVVGTIATLFMTCLAAYPLSKKDLPGRSMVTFIILFTMVFSGGLVPTFLLIKNIGLYNSRLVYILPYLLSAFNIIIVKNFFQSIPASLADSARIDGANEFRILRQIYIPLSKPVLATVGLWTAVIHWNMWFDALIYIDDKSKQVMQIYLQRIVIESDTNLAAKGVVNPDFLSFTPETIKSATVVVTILPILLVYPFIQKYFVKGIMLGSVKE
jgi:putative aldouronate transport system permease protein